MNTRPEVVAELRALFRSGATPSRLLRHVIGQHRDEPHLRFLIQDYFREAFGVDLVRGIDLSVDPCRADLHYAFLNEQLLHEMIERRSVWEGKNQAANGKQPWFGPLTATSDDKRLQEVGASAFPELAKTWDRLSVEERQFVQGLARNVNLLHETVKILAALAEALQQRVCEMETQASKTG